MTVKLELETIGKAREISEGFWLIATRHRPGLSKHLFEINNRCLVFRLHDNGAAPPAYWSSTPLTRPTQFPKFAASSARQG